MTRFDIAVAAIGRKASGPYDTRPAYFEVKIPS